MNIKRVIILQDVYNALKVVISNAAYEHFEEDVKRSIDEGKRADIFLSEPPLDVNIGQIKEIRVRETITDEETIYKLSENH